MRPDWILFSAIAAASATAGVFVLRRVLHKDPDEKERRRRLLVSDQGRLIDGVVTDFHEGVVCYAYSWRGVEYEASQDLRTLSAMFPESVDALTGPVTVKFLPRDPSNSIVFCESWSGFPRYKARRP